MENQLDENSNPQKPNNPYNQEQQHYPQGNPYQNQPLYGMNAQLPNATAVFVLGICSLVFVCAYGFGMILGIIGLVLASKDRKLYKENPSLYSNYGNLNAGWIMSLISVIIGGIFFLFLIVAIAIGLSFASLNDFTSN